MILKNPSGLCECGCGAETGLATHAHHSNGYVTGEHVRFLNGHQRRGRGTAEFYASDGPNPSGLCMCGCGQLTGLAPVSRPSLGHVVNTPLCYLTGHSTRLSPLEYIVEEHSGCWIWQRARDERGYGRITIEGRTQRAHRVFYERSNGPIPPRTEIHHICRNPSCVNPEHLIALPVEAHHAPGAADTAYWMTRALAAEHHLHKTSLW